MNLRTPREERLGLEACGEKRMVASPSVSSISADAARGVRTETGVVAVVGEVDMAGVALDCCGVVEAVDDLASDGAVEVDPSMVKPRPVPLDPFASSFTSSSGTFKPLNFSPLAMTGCTHFFVFACPPA
jgi:hypothetical protein